MGDLILFYAAYLFSWYVLPEEAFRATEPSRSSLVRILRLRLIVQFTFEGVHNSPLGIWRLTKNGR